MLCLKNSKRIADGAAGAIRGLSMQGIGWAGAIAAMIFGALAITSWALDYTGMPEAGLIAGWVEPYRVIVAGPILFLIGQGGVEAPIWLADAFIIHMLFGATAYRYVTLVYRYEDNPAVLIAFMLAGIFALGGVLFGAGAIERTRRDLWLFATQPKYQGQRYSLDWKTFQSELTRYKSAVWLEALVFIAPAVGLGALMLSLNALLSGAF